MTVQHIPPAEILWSAQVDTSNASVDRVLRLELKEWGGGLWLDIRAWTLRANGDLRPTSKGVTVNATHLADLVRLLHAAQDHLDAIDDDALVAD